VEVDWQVFGVDIDDKGDCWKRVGKVSGDRERAKVEKKAQNNQTSFVNENKYEVLEFDEPVSDEIPEKQTELTVYNFMKIKNENLKKPKTQMSKGKKADTPSISRGDSCKPPISLGKKKDLEIEFGPLEVNVVEGERPQKSTRKGKVTIDSGAEVSIWPSTHVSWKNVKPTDESERGIGFVAANGSRMKNYGGTQVKFEKDGKVRAMNFDVTDCKKPLASVAKIVDQGNKVVFDQGESYILNKQTGEKILLERERGTFVMLVEFEIDEKRDAEDTCFRRHA
jgi:hypothetical protein